MTKCELKRTVDSFFFYLQQIWSDQQTAQLSMPYLVDFLESSKCRSMLDILNYVQEIFQQNERVCLRSKRINIYQQIVLSTDFYLYDFNRHYMILAVVFAGRRSDTGV